MNIDELPFIGAAHRRARSTIPTLIVIHSGETNEGSTAAEGMANYFASGKTIGSAHICVDDDSAVRCAYDTERTNGAGGVNDIGLHLEQAGRAGQSAAEWKDDYSAKVVAHAAQVCAGWIGKFPHLRPVFLAAAQLRAGVRNGITTHAEVSQVFPGNDGHWDPGPEYPIDALLAAIGGGTGQSGIDLAAIAAFLAQQKENAMGDTNAFKFKDNFNSEFVDSHGNLVHQYVVPNGKPVTQILAGPSAGIGFPSDAGLTKEKAKPNARPSVLLGLAGPDSIDITVPTEDGDRQIQAYYRGGATWTSQVFAR